MFRLVATDMSAYFFQYSTVITTRDHPFKLFKEHSDINARKSFFSQRIISVWNSLSSDTVDFSTLRSLKRTTVLVDFSPFNFKFIYVFSLYMLVQMLVNVCV